MLSTIKRLYRSEDGNSPMYVVWMIGLIGIGGVSVDTINAYRMRTMMQATADAAALAAVVALPDASVSATNVAVSYVSAIMPPQSNGVLTTENDVVIGRWNPDTRQIEPGVSDPDAVLVRLERSKQRQNALVGTLLQITGFESWDIVVGSMAAVRWRGCAQNDGLISASKALFNSTNQFADGYCVYGKDGLQFMNNNDFEGQTLGALAGVGTNAYANYRCKGVDLHGAQGNFCDATSNPGLEEALFYSDLVYPTRAFDELPGIIADAKINLNTVPSAFDGVNEIYYLEKVWKPKGNKIDEAVMAKLQSNVGYHRTFYFQCSKDTEVFKIDEGVYRNISIVTNCMIDVAGGSNGNPSTYEGVTLITTSSGKFPPDPKQPLHKDANVDIGGGNFLGAGCAADEGLNIWTAKSVKVAGGNTYNGTRITAGSHVVIAGNNDSSSEPAGHLSVHAIGEISVNSSSFFSVCDIGGDTFKVQPTTSLVL